MEEVEVGESTASPHNHQGVLRFLARWLAREALKEKKGRKSPQIRELLPRDSAYLS